MRFFIVGTGRCGSTLLQKMLNTHYELFVFPETHWIPTLLEKFGNTPRPTSDFVDIINRTRFVDGTLTTDIHPYVNLPSYQANDTCTAKGFCDLVGLELAKKTTIRSTGQTRHLTTVRI